MFCLIILAVMLQDLNISREFSNRKVLSPGSQLDTDTTNINVTGAYLNSPPCSLLTSPRGHPSGQET